MTDDKFITSGVLVQDKALETEILVLTRRRAKKPNQSENENYQTDGLKRVLENSLVKETHSQHQTNQFLSERESLCEEG